MKLIHPSDFGIEILKNSVAVSFHDGKPIIFPWKFPENNIDICLCKLARDKKNHKQLKELLGDSFNAFVETYSGEQPFDDVVDLIDLYLSDELSKNDLYESLICVLEDYSKETIGMILDSIPIYSITFNFSGYLPDTPPIYYIAKEHDNALLLQHLIEYLTDEAKMFLEKSDDIGEENFHESLKNILEDIASIKSKNFSSLTFSLPNNRECIHFDKVYFAEIAEFDLDKFYSEL